MMPTTNFQRNFHSHNNNSYVNNSTSKSPLWSYNLRYNLLSFKPARFHQSWQPHCPKRWWVQNSCCRLKGLFWSLHHSVRGFEILSRKAVVTASYNSSEHESVVACLPGTRQDVLDCVCTWADSHGDSTICVLYGPLGSGKTTLATTVAEKYDKEDHLAGTFFFSGDPSHHPEHRSLNRIMATIAYQNSISHPIVRKKVIQVLNSNPAILSKLLETQFQSLYFLMPHRFLQECIHSARFHRNLLDSSGMEPESSRMSLDSTGS